MDSPTALFPEFEIAEPAPTAGPFAGVAIEKSIDRLLDYSIPKRLLAQVRVGQRVRIPLGRGNKTTTGYVVTIHDETNFPRIKPITALDDDRVLVTPKLMALARWMSRYYLTPLGVVLESVIPAAVKQGVGLGYSSIVYPLQSAADLQALLEQTKPKKRRALLGRLLQLEAGKGIELIRLSTEADVTVATVRKLTRAGVIRIDKEVDLPKTAGDPASIERIGAEPEILLNDEQRAAYEAVKAQHGFAVNLLHGVTGSGKTEVYLQCIRDVVNAGKQAIVLVPEISLTPQTVKRFTARFKRVAVIHSGLTASARHRFWQRIAQGEADVIVGARSAIFAPTQTLGLIVVDEEHESSYKQDSAPRYHARDVAIKRGQLEGVPVLLGTATPSLELYQRVTSQATAIAPSPGIPGEGRGEGEFDRKSLLDVRNHPHPSPLPEYRERGPEQTPRLYLPLTRRIRDYPLPHIEMIDMKQEGRFRRGVHLMSQRLEHLLKTTVDSGRQAILLLNRRGYSNFVHCSSCQNAIQCKYCDTTMTYHRSAESTTLSAKNSAGVHSGQLHCHYCLAVNTLPDKCPVCGKKLSLFGLGTQRVEEELKRKFPELRFARVDSDSMRGAGDYEATLAKFASGEIQVLLGTQMIAKGLDFPNVTLVGVISGDTALALPDFRAAERTFQLITQVAGRAGRGDALGRVVLQTFIPDDPTLKFALKHDYKGFAAVELSHRKETRLPPFSRMVRIVLRDQDTEKLNKLSEEIAAAVNDAVVYTAAPVIVKGPMPAAISRIAGYYRNQIVLQAANAKSLQAVLARARQQGALGKNDRVAVDVDPISLL